MKFSFVTGLSKTHRIRTQWQTIISLPITSYINKLTNFHNTTVKVDWSAFLRLASEVCQMFTNVLMFIDEYHSLAFTVSHLAGNHHPTCWWYVYMGHGFSYILWHFVYSGAFKIAELCFIPLFCGSPPTTPI